MEPREEKKERLETALLEYIEHLVVRTRPEISATIPDTAFALIELWKMKENKRSVNEHNIIEYDMNNETSFQCIAIARNEEARDRLLERGYVVFFTPENHNINCWILCREASEVRS